MKKTFLTILSIIILSSAAVYAAKPTVNSDLAYAIRMYKAANYAECYKKLETVIEKDSTNALAYYYLAMTSAQIGKQKEALENYEKAIILAPTGSNLYNYANRGKTCLVNPDRCNETAIDSEDEAFIKGTSKKAFSDKVKSDYERLKIENMMREMNRSNDIAPQEFKEFRDFSSMNTEGTPSNDEIVAALRTLQRAGFGNVLGGNSYYSDLSLLTGDNSSQSAIARSIGNGTMSPQLIQAMLTNNMSFGF